MAIALIFVFYRDRLEPYQLLLITRSKTQLEPNYCWVEFTKPNIQYSIALSHYFRKMVLAFPQ